MAFTFANRGLYTLLTTAVSGSTDIRCGVLTSAGTVLSAAAIKDMNFVSDVLAAGTEAAVAGYARQDLAGVAVAEDDALDKVTLVATAPTIASAAAGETWRQVFYYIEAGSDAARVLIGIDTPASTQITNGGPITLPPLQTQIVSA